LNVWGMSVVEGARAFTWIADEHVILLPGTFQPLLEIIEERLGADASLGTRPELQDGHYTGRTLELIKPKARHSLMCSGSGSSFWIQRKELHYAQNPRP